MSTSLWLAYDHYGYALLAVLGTFAAVSGVSRLAHHPRCAGWLLSWQGVAPPFINILGVLFGLTLAFLANDTWSAHDRAIRAVYREADAMRTTLALSQNLPAPVASQVRGALAQYAQASVDEWGWLAQRTESPAVAERADALLTLIASAGVRDALGANVQTLMLDQVTTMRDERDQRVALSQTHVNPLKWLGMAFLGLLTLLSVAVVHIERPRALLAAVVLFAFGAAPTAAIVLIQGNPFLAPVGVTSAPLQAVLNGLTAR